MAQNSDWEGGRAREFSVLAGAKRQSGATKPSSKRDSRSKEKYLGQYTSSNSIRFTTCST
jgi:hypothetical protein